MVQVPLKFLKSFSKHRIRGIMNGLLYDNMCEHIMYGVQTVTALLKHALPFSQAHAVELANINCTWEAAPRALLQALHTRLPPFVTRLFPWELCFPRVKGPNTDQ